ncbi:MAG: hypothetical protein JO235_22525 [Chroococcidiopsidaceae cyanobacterium CP_BM_RX_35]|nr:hypothetical protein [Chroococcidiopsidaceae cyanobacterium CP_BM_RX_35]
MNRVVFTPQGGVVFLNNINTFYYSDDIPQELRDQLTAIQNIQFANITSFTLTPQGGTVAIAEQPLDVITPYYVNIPQALADKIKTLSPGYQVGSLKFTPSLNIHVIAFTPSNDWVIIAD